VNAPIRPADRAATAPFTWPLRVYWEDTDAGGVVFYANYLKFFERARTEWLRSLGFSQEQLRLDTGVMFVVTDTSVRYRQPARLDEELHVSVRVVEQGRASLVIDQQVQRADTLLVEGRIRIGCVDSRTFVPRRIPPFILERMTAA